MSWIAKFTFFSATFTIEDYGLVKNKNYLFSQNYKEILQDHTTSR